MEEELWRYRTDLEEQITQRSVELLDSRTRLAGIVDSAEDAIISVDSKQQITLFNYGAEKTFGYLKNEVEGRHLSMLIPNRFHDTHRKHVQNFGKSGKVSKRMNDRSEIIAKKKRRDGIPGGSQHFPGYSFGREDLHGGSEGHQRADDV